GKDGITLRLPIYSGGPPPATVAERRARLRGSIAASFIAAELIGSAIEPQTLEALRIAIEDVTDAPARLVYHSDPVPAAPADITYQRDIRFGGRTWRMRMQPGERLAAPWPASTMWLGMLTSVLLALLVWSVAGTRRRALELGWRMSHR